MPAGRSSTNRPDWVHDIKPDGWRIQVRVEDGTATLRTRNGHDYSDTFPELARVAVFDNCLIDGEVCFARKGGITDISDLQVAMKACKTASSVSSPSICFGLVTRIFARCR